MQNRREFLKTTLVMAGSVAATIQAGSAAASAVPGLPSNLIFTRDNPGIWDKKVGAHVPLVSMEGNKVAVVTEHPMTEKHYIVRHTLVSHDGEMLGAQVFTPDDAEARSEYTLPDGYKGKLYVTSFCNMHDFWLTEVKV